MCNVNTNTISIIALIGLSYLYLAAHVESLHCYTCNTTANKPCYKLYVKQCYIPAYSINKKARSKRIPLIPNACASLTVYGPDGGQNMAKDCIYKPSGNKFKCKQYAKILRFEPKGVDMDNMTCSFCYTNLCNKGANLNKNLFILILITFEALCFL